MAGWVHLDLDELRRSGQVNEVIGSANPALSRWLRRVIEDIRTGAVPVWGPETRAEKGGFYQVQVEGYQFSLSVRRRKGKVLSCWRVPE